MRIYFTASSRDRKTYGKLYRDIVEILQQEGHDVYTEILSEHLPEFSLVSRQQLLEWSKKWSSYIRDCDFSIVEGSYPSTIHIGFEIGMILARGKPVVLLYQRGCDPIFLNEFSSSRLIKSEYETSDLREVLRWGIEEVVQLSSRRFTFYINSEIDEFLSNVVEERGVSRSEYIRELLQREMKKKVSSSS